MIGRPRTAFLSGEFQSWSSYRDIHVWKYCKKALVRGLLRALEQYEIRSIKVTLNGRELKPGSYKIEKDHIRFQSMLRPKYKSVKKPWYIRWFSKEKKYVMTEPRCHCLHISVLYDHMRGVVYG